MHGILGIQLLKTTKINFFKKKNYNIHILFPRKTHWFSLHIDVYFGPSPIIKYDIKQRFKRKQQFSQRPHVFGSGKASHTDT